MTIPVPAAETVLSQDEGASEAEPSGVIAPLISWAIAPLRSPACEPPAEQQAGAEVDGPAALVPPAAPLIPDAQLLASFVQRRDADAFTEIVQRYRQMVYRVALRAVDDRDLADDVFQATFLVLSQSARKIKRGDALAAWLHGTARNIARRALTLRHNERQQLQQHAQQTLAEKGEAMTTSTDDDPFVELVRRHEQQLLDEELQKLPEASRAPLVLFYLEQKSQSEIAQLMGMTVEAVEGRLKRAKQELRQRLIRRGVLLSTIVTAATVLTPSLASAAPASTLVSSTITSALGAGAAGSTLLGATAAGTTLAKGATTATTLAAQEVAAMSVASKATVMLLATAVSTTLVTGLMFGAIVGTFSLGRGHSRNPQEPSGIVHSMPVPDDEFGTHPDALTDQEATLLALADPQESTEPQASENTSDATIDNAEENAEENEVKAIVYQIGDLSADQQQAAREYAEERSESTANHWKTQSIVVRATRQQHRQIGDFLTQVRKGNQPHEDEQRVLATSGKIKKVKNDRSNRPIFAELSIGKDDGLTVGQKLHVTRTDDVTKATKFIGDVRIIELQPDFAVAEVVNDSTYGIMEVGDQVTTQLGNEEPAKSELAQTPAAGQSPAPLSDEMKRFLTQWEDKSKSINSLQSPITRLEYDRVFHQETRSTGTLYLERPDRWRVDFEPADAASLSKPSQRVDANGNGFQVHSSRSATKWICAERQIYIMNISEKCYDRLTLSPQGQTQSFSWNPLTYIFGLTAEEAQKQFSLRFGEMNNPDGKSVSKDGQPRPKQIHVIAKPVEPRLSKEYSEIEVLFDVETLLPLNLRIIDTSRNKETVYSFGAIQLNQEVKWGDTTPFVEPNLAGWKLMHSMQYPMALPSLGSLLGIELAEHKSAEFAQVPAGTETPEAKPESQANTVEITEQQTLKQLNAALKSTETTSKRVIVDRRAQLEKLVIADFDPSVHGKITRVNPDTGTVWIDIGSENPFASRYHPTLPATLPAPVTMSVFKAYQPGMKHRPQDVKARIDVFEVHNHYSIARIVEEDRERPLAVEDGVYSPVLERRFAIVGNYDLNHDGECNTRDRELLRHLIVNAGGSIDIEINDNGDRSPSGKIITEDISMLIVGDLSDPETAANDPAKLEQILAVRRQHKNMVLEAMREQVDIINLEDFMSYAGLNPVRPQSVPGQAGFSLNSEGRPASLPELDQTPVAVPSSEGEVLPEAPTAPAPEAPKPEPPAPPVPQPAPAPEAVKLRVRLFFAETEQIEKLAGPLVDIQSRVQQPLPDFETALAKLTQDDDLDVFDQKLLAKFGQSTGWLISSDAKGQTSIATLSGATIQTVPEDLGAVFFVTPQLPVKAEALTLDMLLQLRNFTNPQPPVGNTVQRIQAAFAIPEYGKPVILGPVLPLSFEEKQQAGSSRNGFYLWVEAEALAPRNKLRSPREEIEREFHRILERQPTPRETEAWLSEWANGNPDLLKLRAILWANSNVYQRADAKIESLVSMIYQSELEHFPTAAELQAWKQRASELKQKRLPLVREILEKIDQERLTRAQLPASPPLPVEKPQPVDQDATSEKTSSDDRSVNDILDQTVELEIDHIPLKLFLSDLADEANVGIILDGDIVEDDLLVSISAHKCTRRQVLKALAAEIHPDALLTSSNDALSLAIHRRDTRQLSAVVYNMSESTRTPTEIDEFVTTFINPHQDRHFQMSRIDDQLVIKTTPHGHAQMEEFLHQTPAGSSDAAQPKVQVFRANEMP